MCMAPFNLDLRNSRFDIDVPELFVGVPRSNERNVRPIRSWLVAAEVHTRADGFDLIRDRVKD